MYEKATAALRLLRISSFTEVNSGILSFASLEIPMYI